VTFLTTEGKKGNRYTSACRKDQSWVLHGYCPLLGALLKKAAKEIRKAGGGRGGEKVIWCFILSSQERNLRKNLTKEDAIQKGEEGCYTGSRNRPEREKREKEYSLRGEYRRGRRTNSGREKKSYDTTTIWRQVLPSYLL